MASLRSCHALCVSIREVAFASQTEQDDLRWDREAVQSGLPDWALWGWLCRRWSLEGVLGAA